MTSAFQIPAPLALAAGSSVAIASVFRDLIGSAGVVVAAAVLLGVVAATPRLAAARARLGARASKRPSWALRDYVPSTLAQCIASGEELDCGEREVTVMFLDLHGYTSFAEGLAPDEVFHFISRFTHAVSASVQRCGGYVVEFNGDGMMVVFGAPIARPDKERAALRAARATLEAVAALEAESPRGGAGVPPVEIGIATGPAFVGRIRAADRWIWSAVGTTTNLASRLQRLARELGASVAIDAATRAGAGLEPELQEIPRVRIRGLSEPLDVHALPRREAGSARPLLVGVEGRAPGTAVA